MFRALLVLLCSSLALFSDNALQLHRRILDQSKRPVREAAIVISDQAGRTFLTTATGTAGQFVVPLAPRQYLVIVERNGFTKQVTPVAMTHRDQQITIALRLTAGSISITVYDQATKLDTASDSHQFSETECERFVEFADSRR